MVTSRYGAEIMLDVGLYQLDQQAACQRYRQNFVIADAFTRAKEGFKNAALALFGQPLSVSLTA